MKDSQSSNTTKLLFEGPLPRKKWVPAPFVAPAKKDDEIFFEEIRLFETPEPSEKLLQFITKDGLGHIAVQTIVILQSEKIGGYEESYTFKTPSVAVIKSGWRSNDPKIIAAYKKKFLSYLKKYL